MSGAQTDPAGGAPYPGLRPFRRDESDLFFGRDEQVDQLLSRLEQRRFLAVVGVSGCGKSSLVRAGMLAALERGFLASAGTRWNVAEMRPGNRPLSHLAHALLASGWLGEEWSARDDAHTFLVAALRRGPLSLVELLAESPGANGGSLLILVDQFEEIFRFHRHHDPNEALAFVDLLLTAAAEKLPLYVTLTMRSDFLGDCSIFTGLPEAINQGEFLIPRLTRAQCRAAIVGPAAAFGATVEEELVTRILNDMGTDPDRLPLIQHALMRVWSRATAASGWPTPAAHGETPVGRTAIELRLVDYEAVGGLDGALSNHADELYSTLGAHEQRIAEILMRSLSERGADQRDTRRPTSLAAVAAAAQNIPEAVARVVEVFRQPDCSFLTPPVGVPLEPEVVLDIGHESLIWQWKRMSAWVQSEADSGAVFRRLSETARLWSDGRAALWTTPDLENALAWRDRERPGAAWAERYGGGFEESMRFLDASVVARDARLKEEAARREREMELLADRARTEKERADDADARRREQLVVNRRLRSRAFAALAAGCLAGVLALAALWLYWRAVDERDRAATAEGEAIVAQSHAEKAAVQSAAAARSEAAARSDAEKLARQLKQSQSEAVVQTLGAYAALASANLAQSQSLWNAAESGRQQKALTLLREVSSLQETSTALSARLEGFSSDELRRIDASWAQLLPQVRSDAVRWLTHTALQPVGRLASATGLLPQFAMSPTGKALALLEPDPAIFGRGVLRVVEPSTGNTTAQLAWGENGAQQCLGLSFSEDEQALLCLGANLTGGQWGFVVEKRAANDLRLLASIKIAQDGSNRDSAPALVNEWRFDETGKRLARLNGTTLRIWDLADGQLAGTLTGASWRELHWTGNEAIGVVDGSKIRFASLQTGDVVREYSIDAPGKSIRALYSSPDEQWLIVRFMPQYLLNGYGVELQILERTTGRKAGGAFLALDGAVFESIDDESRLVTFHPQGHLIASLTGQTVSLVSVPEGAVVQQARIADTAANSSQQTLPIAIQFNNDGTLLASAAKSQFTTLPQLTVRLWDPAVARVRAIMHPHETPIRSAAFGDSDRQILAGGGRPAPANRGGFPDGETETRTLRVETVAGDQVWRTRPEPGPAGFDPGGRSFIHVLADRACVYDVSDGGLLHSIPRTRGDGRDAWPVSPSFRWICGMDRDVNPPGPGLFDTTAREWKSHFPEDIVTAVFSPTERHIAVRPVGRSPGGLNAAKFPARVYRTSDLQCVLSLDEFVGDLLFAGEEFLIQSNHVENRTLLVAYELAAGREIARWEDTERLFITQGSVHVSAPNGRSIAFVRRTQNQQELVAWNFADGDNPKVVIGNFLVHRETQLTSDRLVAAVQTVDTQSQRIEHHVHLFNLKTGERLVDRNDLPSSTVRLVADRELIVLSSEDQEDRPTATVILDLVTGRELQRFNSVIRGISTDGGIALLADGRAIDLQEISQSRSTAVGPAEERFKFRIEPGPRATWLQCHFTRDDRIVVLRGTDGLLAVCRLDADRSEFRIQGADNPTFTCDDHTLLTQTADGLLRVQRLDSQTASRELAAPADHVIPLGAIPSFGPVLLSADGGHFAVKAAGQWQLGALDEDRPLAALPRSSHDRAVRTVDVDGTGRLIASGGEDRTVCFWNFPDGRFLGMLAGFRSTVVAVHFAREQPLIAVREETGGISVWEWAIAETRNGRSVAARHLWSDINAAGRIVRLSPDGTELASGDASGTVRLFDAKQGVLLQLLQPVDRHSPIEALAYQPQGSHLAIANGHSALALWNRRERRLEQQRDAGQAAVRDLAFSADGRLLASAGNGVRLWNVSNGQLWFSIDRPLRVVSDINLSPSGRWLAAVADDRTTMAIDFEQLTDSLDQMGLSWNDRDRNEPAGPGNTGNSSAVPGWKLADDTALQRERVRGSHSSPAEQAEAKHDWHDASNHLQELCRVDPANPNYRWRLARSLGETGRWNEAEAEWLRVAELLPQDPYPGYCSAIAALGDGRFEDYRRHCGTLLDRFGGTQDPAEAGRLLYATVPVPGAVDDVSVLVRLSEIANQPRLRGAALFRNAMFEPAIEQLRRQDENSARPWDLLFLSMACAETGQTEEARRLLAVAERLFESMQRDKACAWHEAVETRLLIAEANRLAATKSANAQSSR